MVRLTRTLIIIIIVYLFIYLFIVFASFFFKFTIGLDFFVLFFLSFTFLNLIKLMSSSQYYYYYFSLYLLKPHSLLLLLSNQRLSFLNVTSFLLLETGWVCSLHLAFPSSTPSSLWCYCTCVPGLSSPPMYHLRLSSKPRITTTSTSSSY